MTERYRKLPGSRRGILHGASLWIGSGHLLSVRSSRFREEYKRFFLSDVQAIVVARMPRFHLSTRSVAIAAAFAIAYLFLRGRVPWADAVFSTAGGLLIAAWVFLSARYSCICRIHTAVSRDELPGIYRTWTARRFLAAVTPRIAEVQGVMEEEWRVLAGEHLVGPYTPVPLRAEEPAGIAAGAAPSVEEPSIRAARAWPQTRTGKFAGYSLAASLLAGALARGLTLKYDSQAAFLALYGFTLLVTIACVTVLLLYHGGTVRRAVQRLALISLLATGAIFYIEQVAVGVRTRGTIQSTDVATKVRAPSFLTWIGIAADTALGLAGLILMRDEAGR